MPLTPHKNLNPNLGGAVLSVSALARSVRDILESRFPLLWVRGEISNFMRARSGHSYFVLKDDLAQARCVMFRHRSHYLDWQPADGMQVEVQALVSLYEPRGEFQLNVEAMRRAGTGALYERFLKLREKLEREGLFDAGLKRDLPEFPRVVGVVTSLQAAALRDILTTLKRRNPSIQVVVYPVMVQGDGAAAQIAEALLVAGRRAECDVLIVARGGGSIEDLWAFNEERVARAIRACTIPVVSGVGHETDVTIADLAADRRAPTPTAAAEMVSPDGAALQLHVAALARRLCDNAARDLEYRMQRLDMLTKSLEHPRHRLELQLERIRGLRNRLAAAWIARRDAQQWRLAALLHRMHARLPRPADRQLLVRRAAERLSSTIKGRLSACESMTAALASSLDHLSPQRVLSRGYSVVRDARGVIVRNAATLAGGDELDITLASGGARARVEQTR